MTLTLSLASLIALGPSQAGPLDDAPPGAAPWTTSALPPHPDIGIPAPGGLPSASWASAEQAMAGLDAQGLLDQQPWQTWTALLDVPAEDLPAAIAKRQGLELAPPACQTPHTSSLASAVDRLGLAMGEPMALQAPVELGAETRAALASLVACMATHVEQMPALPPEARVPSPAHQAAWLAAQRDILHQIASFPQATAGQAIQCLDAGCWIQVGGSGDDTYLDTAVIVLDTGGHDTYRNNAGGASPAWTGTPMALVLDQGHGHDTYAPNMTDTYNFPTLGAGYLGGLGFLVDQGGDDRYEAVGTTMGSGFSGAGFLWEQGGSDRYISPAPADGGISPGQSQKVTAAAAAFGGYGILVDETGDDVYHQEGVDSIGWGGGGGLGLLVERDGHDSYQADPAITGDATSAGGGELVSGVSIGVGELSGVGILLDGAGQDKYGCGQPLNYGCIGASYYGGHLGLVYDRAGADTYHVPGARTSDVYFPGGLGASGVTGVGLVVEERGADTYTGEAPRSLGYGAGGLGAFLDLGGIDTYTLASQPWLGTRGDDQVWTGDAAYPGSSATAVGLDTGSSVP